MFKFIECFSKLIHKVFVKDRHSFVIKYWRSIAPPILDDKAVPIFYENFVNQLQHF